ncbi:unnamed protein product [Choristocarpus tenellus]
MFFHESTSSNSVEDEEDDDVYQYPKSTGVGCALAALEGLLRCGICRAICDAPMALPCCMQAYCSLCIRTSLVSTKPRCPKCRDPADPNKLALSRELREVSPDMETEGYSIPCLMPAAFALPTLAPTAFQQYKKKKSIENKYISISFIGSINCRSTSVGVQRWANRGVVNNAAELFSELESRLQLLVLVYFSTAAKRQFLILHPKNLVLRRHNWSSGTQ